MGRRSEETEVHGGLGKLRIVDSPEEYASGLEFDGRLITVGWSDGSGSIAQYFAHLGYNSTEIADTLAGIRACVAGGVPEAVPLDVALAPLLELLADGRYRLEQVDSEELHSPDRHSSTTIDYASDVRSYARGLGKREPHPTVWNLYPSAQNLMFIHAARELDAACVLAWRDQIQAGRRPCVITLGREDGLFQHVIDGHHKACAYGLLSRAPRVLAIYALDPPSIALDFHCGLRLVDEAAHGSPMADPRGIANYRARVPRTVDYRLSWSRMDPAPLYDRLWRLGWREGAMRLEAGGLVLGYPIALPPLVPSEEPVTLQGEARAAWGNTVRMLDQLADACGTIGGTKIHFAYELRDPITGEIARRG